MTQLRALTKRIAKLEGDKPETQAAYRIVRPLFEPGQTETTHAVERLSDGSFSHIEGNWIAKDVTPFMAD